MIDITFIRIFRLLNRFCVGRNLLYFFEHAIFFFKEPDIVIVRFGHFPSISSHYGCDLISNQRSWYFESFPIASIEFLSDISSIFHMLLLIFSNWHKIRIIEQNIRCHQNRITKSSNADFSRFSLCQSVFVAVHSFHRSHNRQASQSPVELRVSRNFCRIVNQGFCHISSTSKIELYDRHTIFFQNVRLLRLRKAVHICEKKKKF